MKYHLKRFVKCEISLEEFKNKISFEENCKSPLKLVNSSIKLKGLVRKL